ncbi:hypothetical protein Y695_03604 [Hydrogenophaga sp. T4]|nr:hypothetical protein Y695_03604 [Hydrogenophaga sp. T4]
MVSAQVSGTSPCCIGMKCLMASMPVAFSMQPMKSSRLTGPLLPTLSTRWAGASAVATGGTAMTLSTASTTSST